MTKWEQVFPLHKTAYITDYSNVNFHVFISSLSLFCLSQHMQSSHLQSCPVSFSSYDFFFFSKTVQSSCLVPARLCVPLVPQRCLLWRRRGRNSVRQIIHRFVWKNHQSMSKSHCEALQTQSGRSGGINKQINK